MPDETDPDSSATAAAGDQSFKSREQILRSTRCGCYYCLATFAPFEIVEWTDFVDGEGQTAICPRCSVDSVLGDLSGQSLERENLMHLHVAWFGPWVPPEEVERQRHAFWDRFMAMTEAELRAADAQAMNDETTNHDTGVEDGKDR